MQFFSRCAGDCLLLFRCCGPFARRRNWADSRASDAASAYLRNPPGTRLSQGVNRESRRSLLALSLAAEVARVKTSQYRSNAIRGPALRHTRSAQGLSNIGSSLPLSGPLSGATTQKKRKKGFVMRLKLKMEMRPLGWFLYRDQSLGNKRRIVIKIKDLIQASGFRIPVLARGNGEVIVGDLSVKAAHMLGLAEAPVILCDGWTLGQIRVFQQLAKEAAWSEWSLQSLARV